MDELLIHAWIKVDPGYILCEQTKQYSYIQGIPGKKDIQCWDVHSWCSLHVDGYSFNKKSNVFFYLLQ